MNENIRVENLSARFKVGKKSIKVVDNINYVFESGKVTGIIGESGSGKSVLAMSMLQLLPRNSFVEGSCIHRDRNLLKMGVKDIREVRAKQIGVIAQNPMKSLNPVMKVGKQITEPLICNLGMSSSEARTTCIAFLEDFGFPDPLSIMNRYPFQLSGGMNQRIISIMGLVCRPGWIIADEPTKGLDSILRKNVYEVLLRINQNYTPSMILITHDLYFARKICHNMVIMYRGEIIESGKTSDIFSKPVHPYTKGLIDSTPKNGMIPIPDSIEKTGPSSCKFFSRCEKSSGKCLGEVKPMLMENGRIVRCSNHD